MRLHDNDNSYEFTTRGELVPATVHSQLVICLTRFCCGNDLLLFGVVIPDDLPSLRLVKYYESNSLTPVVAIMNRDPQCPVAID